jgi:hypothetical protein
MQIEDIGTEQVKLIPHKNIEERGEAVRTRFTGAFTCEWKSYKAAAQIEVPDGNVTVDLSFVEGSKYLISLVTCMIPLASEAARCVSHTTEFQVPATWWEAFKEHYCKRWWMRWYVLKHPVQKRVLKDDFREVVTARALFPTIPYKLGEHSVIFAWTGGHSVIHKTSCLKCGSVFVDEEYLG